MRYDAGRGILRLAENPWEDVDDTLDVIGFLRCLSRRQRSVAFLWMMGWTQAEIGALLGISQQAVSKCLSSHRRKHGAPDPAGL